MENGTTAECTKCCENTNEMLLILPAEGNESLIDKVNFEMGISFLKICLCVCGTCVCI